jgi:lipopolysaccharide export system permease protein
LQDVTETTWLPATPTSLPRVDQKKLAQMSWPTWLDASVAAAAVLPSQSMGAVDLWRYSTHLAEQEQATQTYRQLFWKRVLYPFACLVMVALALPFAYLHARAGGVSLKVFGGIMLGISFVLLNNVVGHLGSLHEWTPWIAASVPSVVYLLMSMSAFAWLVRYR